MKAIVLRTLGEPEVLRLEDVPDPTPGSGEVCVRVRAAALNHRDVWIRTGRYAGIKTPIILGSDGAGEVAAIGADVDPRWRGRAVLINPSLGWGPDERMQGREWRILGLPDNGTYAELVTVPAESLHDKPSHLSFEQAAAIPLASLTAYRALVTRAQLQADETVVVTGIGGGVASTALLIAARLGARVFVTSGSDAKLEAARRHGASGGVNYTAADWPKALITLIGERPDVVIDGTGGEIFNQCLDLVKPGGRVVSYGATLGPAPALEVRRVFWKHLDVLGSTMGTPRDFAGMLQLYADGLQPVIDTVLPLSEAADAHRRMEEGRQFGKIVLRI